MKKKLWLLALPLLISACSSDDDKLSLNTKETVLNTDDTEQLTASENATWTSENEFVAEVDKNGIVTANFVGETYIVATGESGSAKCKVTVAPIYNTYIEPLFTWGASKNEIKKSEKRSLIEEVAVTDGVRLTFNSTENTIYQVGYLFDNSGKMYASAAYVKLSSGEEATKFLIERYATFDIGDGDTDYIASLVNDFPDKATMFVSVLLNDNYLLVLYSPLDNNSTRSISDVEALRAKFKDLTL